MKKVMKTVALTGIIAALSFTSAEAFAATAPANVAVTAMETAQTGGGSTLGEFVSENEVLVGHHGGGHGNHSRHQSHKDCGKHSGHSYKNCPYN